jgi:hypothetical protein
MSVQAVSGARSNLHTTGSTAGIRIVCSENTIVQLAGSGLSSELDLAWLLAMGCYDLRGYVNRTL